MQLRKPQYLLQSAILLASFGLSREVINRECRPFQSFGRHRGRTTSFLPYSRLPARQMRAKKQLAKKKNKGGQFS